MARIVLELDGDPKEVEEALHYLVETGEVKMIQYRTMENVPIEKSIVADWCASAVVMNEGVMSE